MKESELGENVWIVVAPGRAAGGDTGLVQYRCSLLKTSLP
jgi:hypothetical protein